MAFPFEGFIEKEQRQEFWRRLIRRVFLEDWGTKLIALAISIALWLGVTGLRAPISVNLKPVPLIMQVSNDMEITSPQQEIEISVTGDKRKIDPLIVRVNSRDLVASLDLTNVKSGERTVLLSPETLSLDLPSGVKLDAVQPSRIPITLERVEEREIEVRPDIEGTLPNDLEIYAVNVVPAKIRVRGAESLVRSISSISTEPVNLDNRRESFVASQIGLSVANPRLTILDAVVDVNFRIGEKRVERVISVPVKADQHPNEPKTATVLLYGASSLIEKLRPDEMHVEFQPGDDGQLAPRLILPADLQDKIEVRRIKLP